MFVFFFSLLVSYNLVRNQNSRLHWFDTALFGQFFYFVQYFSADIIEYWTFCVRNFRKNWETLLLYFVIKCMLNGSSMFRLSKFSMSMRWLVYFVLNVCLMVLPCLGSHNSV